MSADAPLSARSLTRLGFIGSFGYLYVFGLGWLVLNHFFPPFAPSDTAAEMAQHFLDRRTPIMLGSVCIMVATMVLMIYAATLVLIIRRAERGFGPYTIVMLFSQATYLILNFYLAFFFAVAVFRVDRDPALIQLAGDIGFMQLMGGIPMFLMIWIVTAAVALTAPRDRAVVPRWYGYVSLWCVILYLPELLIFFFHTGPFAWDGVVGFWIPAILFIVYFTVTPFAIRDVARSHPTDA